MSAPGEGLRGSIAGSVKNARARFAQIDRGKLEAFIASQPEICGAIALSEIAYPSTGAGSSNGIGFFSALMDRGDGRSLHDLVIRYSPGVALLKQKRFADEFSTVKAVHAAGLPVPRPFWVDPDGERVGTPAFIMERVRGDAPAAAMYSSGPLAEMLPAQRKATMLDAAGFHGQLRRAALGPREVPHLALRGAGHTAMARELTWWLREAELVRSGGDAKLAFVRSVHGWMLDHQPKAYTPNLVHGDAQIANIIFREGRIAAVIDWELSYLGHNEADLALVVSVTETQKILDKPVDGTPSEAEYIARYEAESGRSVEHWEYFVLFNEFKCLTVMLLVADVMPSFETVWGFYLENLNKAWRRARIAAGQES